MDFEKQQLFHQSLGQLLTSLFPSIVYQQLELIFPEENGVWFLNQQTTNGGKLQTNQGVFFQSANQSPDF
jgi:hypothetical protein